MKIIKQLSVKNECYQEGRYITPRGIMLHSVGCPQPNAKVFADNWNSYHPFGAQVAVHGVVQSDGTAYQCLPWNMFGWHSGGAANGTHIGIEMTEPSCIRYTAGSNFVCTDKETAVSQVKGTYNTAVGLFAYLCKMYNLDPMQDGVIISHAEGYKRGIASWHSDPEHLWNGLGIGFTMNGFRADVKKKMSGASNLYRVRKSLADASSQIGAYASLENAKRACLSGYYVFDNTGKIIYPVVSNSAIDYAQSFDAAKAGSYTVSADVGLHLRAGAGTDKRSIEILPYGARVQCYGYYTNGWLLVKAPSGNVGFVYSEYLS